MRFKSDTPTLILFLNAFLSSKLAVSLNCDKTFTYYEEYGQNSFNVSCSGITKGYEHILENITINNEISLTVTDSMLENVTPDIFKNVKNIKILNVLNCTFEFDKNLDIFNKLLALETLMVQDTHFEIHNETLKGLTNLKRLDLINNSISEIAKGAFQDLINLEKLELIDNHLKNVEDLPLCELTKLKTLKLARNLISSLKSYRFFCLKNAKSLDFNINREPALPNIYQAYYLNVSTTNYDLIELDLSFNQIVDLGYSLENLSKLKLLNVSYNKLVSVKYAYFNWLFRLQKLILRNNELRMFDSRIFVNKTLLSLVDLSYNQLSSFSACDVSQLQYLELRHNNISNVYLKKLMNLKKVNLELNKLRHLDANSFQEVPNLISLNLAGNNLNLRLGLFQNVTSLKYLFLSNNSLHNIPEKVFLGLKSLKFLDLSLNNLHELNPNTFLHLHNLESLNLSYNAIESISYVMLEPLTSLRSIDLAANKLSYIEYDVILSKLPVLSNINIKFNLLTCENLAKIIAFLKQRHIVYTNSEHLDVDSLNQNVAGIPCRSATKNYLMAVETRSKASVTLFNLGIFFLVVLVSVITGIIMYRFYIYLKRRRYRADEFELVVD